MSQSRKPPRRTVQGSGRYGSQGAPRRRASGPARRPPASRPKRRPAGSGGREGFTVDRRSDGREVIHQEHYRAHGSRLTNPDAYGGSRGRLSGRTPRRAVDTRTTLARKRRLVIIIVAAIIAVAVFFGVRACQASAPVEVMVNGATYEFEGGTTVESVATGPYVSVKPGNLVAVDGSLLEEGGGSRFTVKLNGTSCDDLRRSLSSGDILTITDGLDITEEYDTVESVVPHQVSITGSGPISVLVRNGQDGIENVLTGRISGKTKNESVQKSQNALVKKFGPSDTHRLVALTFNDGPGEYTQQVIDVLSSKGVKATFFVNGADVTASPQAAQAIAQSGNQIALHAYEDRDLTALDEESVRTSIASTHDAIQQATGVDSHVMRAPALTFAAREWRLAEGVVTYLVGASVDSHDLQAEGADAITASIMENVEPGDVVMLHAGGGDVSKTVEALPGLIDQLQAAGYQLVTIDEMISMSEVPTA